MPCDAFPFANGLTREHLQQFQANAVTETTNQEDLEKTYQTFIKVWERVPYVSTAAVQTVLNFTRHPGAKAAKPEQFIDNSLLNELEKSGFVSQIYGR